MPVSVSLCGADCRVAAAGYSAYDFRCIDEFDFFVAWLTNDQLSDHGVVFRISGNMLCVCDAFLKNQSRSTQTATVRI